MSMDHIWDGKALVLDKLMVLGNLRHWLVLIHPLAVKGTYQWDAPVWSKSRKVLNAY